MFTCALHNNFAVEEIDRAIFMTLLIDSSEQPQGISYKSGLRRVDKSKMSLKIIF